MLDGLITTMRAQTLSYLEYLEVKNSYIFLIDIVIFKLRLINFVYFLFEITAILPDFLALQGILCVSQFQA